MSKFALYLMTFKGYKTLDVLIKNNQCELISYVIYGKDKNIKKDYSEEIVYLCQANNIKYFSRAHDTSSLSSEYIITISWRWIIKTEVKSPIIVLHDSLLPKYRGFSPLVSCLINRETKIGVTAIFANDEYDKGNIIDQEQIAISYPIKIKNAIEKITVCYSQIVMNIFNTIKSGRELDSIPQNEKDASYSLWRDDIDYQIDWSQSADSIKRFIDSVGYPYKGAITKLENKLVVILESTVMENVKIENRMVGKLIYYNNDKPVIVCGDGLIRLDEIVYQDSRESILPLKKFRTRFL